MSRCGKCEGCMAEDCGKCVFCKDKKKFGGPGTRKRKCILKKCWFAETSNGKQKTTGISEPTPRETCNSPSPCAPENNICKEEACCDMMTDCIKSEYIEEMDDWNECAETSTNNLSSKAVIKPDIPSYSSNSFKNNLDAGLNDTTKSIFPKKNQGNTNSLIKSYNSLINANLTGMPEDCGLCIYCKDKKKFGGPGIKKRKCIEKKNWIAEMSNNKKDKMAESEPPPRELCNSPSSLAGNIHKDEEKSLSSIRTVVENVIDVDSKIDEADSSNDTVIEMSTYSKSDKNETENCNIITDTHPVNDLSSLSIDIPHIDSQEDWGWKHYSVPIKKDQIPKARRIKLRKARRNNRNESSNVTNKGNVFPSSISTNSDSDDVIFQKPNIDLHHLITNKVPIVTSEIVAIVTQNMEELESNVKLSISYSKSDNDNHKLKMAMFDILMCFVDKTVSDISEVTKDFKSSIVHMIADHEHFQKTGIISERLKMEAESLNMKLTTEEPFSCGQYDEKESPNLQHQNPKITNDIDEDINNTSNTKDSICCSMCQSNSKSKCCLYKNQNDVHSSTKNEKRKKRNMHRRDDWFRSLWKRRRRVLKKLNRKFVSANCHHAFLDRNNLFKQRNINTEEKPTKCDYSQKKLERTHKYHNRIRTKEKPGEYSRLEHRRKLHVLSTKQRLLQTKVNGSTSSGGIFDPNMPNNFLL